PFSVSRQPESIRFTLDLPGMRCGIVNHSRDSPARTGTTPRLLHALNQAQHARFSASPVTLRKLLRLREFSRIFATLGI
ncbi:hypothetical protein, partial [Bradyrhizobium sp. 142]|uniref:hypothetical protein n=1 Tax=Bradyrhizobium sp. 142 TaxID=2782618 RepID=UPI001FF99A6B